MSLIFHSAAATKVKEILNKESEDSLIWNDTTLNIDWKVNQPIISDQDQSARDFKTFKTLF